MLKWTESVGVRFVTLIEVSRQALISEENSVFMISQFEPLITNIELSKAQKYQPSKLSLIPQEETFNPVPVFKAQFLVVSNT